MLIHPLTDSFCASRSCEDDYLCGKAHKHNSPTLTLYVQNAHIHCLRPPNPSPSLTVCVVSTHTCSFYLCPSLTVCVASTHTRSLYLPPSLWPLFVGNCCTPALHCSWWCATPLPARSSARRCWRSPGCTQMSAGSHPSAPPVRLTVATGHWPKWTKEHAVWNECGLVPDSDFSILPDSDFFHCQAKIQSRIWQIHLLGELWLHVPHTSFYSVDKLAATEFALKCCIIMMYSFMCYYNNDVHFYVLFFQAGAHSPLQSKEPKHRWNKLLWVWVCTHMHARTHTHTHIYTHRVNRIAWRGKIWKMI